MFSLKVEARGIVNTGHDDIKEIEFVNTEVYHEILSEMSNSQINDYLDKVPHRAFGWSAFVINDHVPVYIIKDVIFSRSNNTTQELKITYDVKYTKTEELEKSISGSIATKISGKIKGINAGVDATIKGDVKKTIKDYYEEKTDFTIRIPQGTKISLQVKADAQLSTGVGKYYFLGITLKKGTWEYIDIITEYYELLEEKL